MRGGLTTQILTTRTRAEFDAAVRQAARALRAGEIVALPTETVYGLAANALDPRAVARIYAAKGRPAHNPIIVHVVGRRMARQYVAEWPETANALAVAFWPGPLTLVLRRAAAIPPIVTAGGQTVGLRWPAHPFIQAVIRECGFPLAAPSANRSNRVSPTSAEHVWQSLAGRIPLLVDGGPAPVGIESTVLDLTRVPARILRPGMVHRASLTAVLGPRRVVFARGSGGEALRSPGLLKKHYAPKAKLRLVSWHSGPDLARQLARLGARPEDCHLIAHARFPVLPGLAGLTLLPRDAAAFARSIYAEMHRCDAAGVRWIIVEAPPARPEWRGIADRLRRAAA
jgi:L-threonylcarbamoyladenylate synthase